MRFSSSIRLEILKRRNENLCENENQQKKHKDDYYIRIVYDDEEIKLKFCISLFCKFEEFTNFVYDNLITDLKEAEKFCNNKWI